MKKTAAILLTICLLLAAAYGSGEELYVRRVENLPEDFILGMDISSVIALEESGTGYYGFDGKSRDVFGVLADNGINAVRVRVWVDPYDAKGRGYGGGNCDIDKAVRIGARAAQYGMKLIVSFHYSDFWADPSKQMAPKAWKKMSIQEKTQAVYDYTRESLLKLRDAGADVAMVALGNETNGKLCGESTWFNISYLLQAGSKAVREVFPEALAAVHFTNPEKGNYLTYAGKLDYYHVDYDVFASSYYPYWHGTLENLADELNKVTDAYGKKTMVMETSYAFTSEDSDFYGNTVSDGGAIVKNYPFTVQGQANSVRDITDTLVNRVKAGIGIVYWEGAWIAAGGASWEENSEKWERYGIGWATSYAKGYDPADAGRYYGGNAVDNQAMFDASGRPLESLKVFALMRTGNETDIRADATEDVTLICDINGPIVLPETVNAVMNDDSRTAIPVEWDFTREDDRAMHEGGVAGYDITGTAGGMPVHCWVSMVEYNYLTDYSFEEGGRGWVLTDLKKADELYIEDKKSDSLTGTKHAHFWSAGKNTVEFTLEQRVDSLPEGRYRYTVSIMGGDCGATDIYAYVSVNGEIISRAPMKITSYGNWDTVTAPDFDYTDGEVKVGVYVRCEGSGNGAWGKIDDALLNSVR